MKDIANSTRNALMEGFHRAYQDNQRFCGRSFHRAPEYYVTVKIAEQLGKYRKGYSTTIEPLVHEVLQRSKAVSKGKVPHKLRNSGRFDIVVWQKKGHIPKLLIEVKHPVSQVRDALRDDLRRLHLAITRGTENTVRAAYLVMYCHSVKGTKTLTAARENLKDLRRKLANEAREIVGTDCSVRISVGKRVIDKDIGGGPTRWGRALCVQLKAT